MGDIKKIAGICLIGLPLVTDPEGSSRYNVDHLFIPRKLVLKRLTGRSHLEGYTETALSGSSRFGNFCHLNPGIPIVRPIPEED